VTFHHAARGVVVHYGDCLEVMAVHPDASVDAIVTDPPYGLGFMGRKWDALPPGEKWAAECLRVLKPGGHLLAFGGSRTWHRLAVAVEDAGFEVRDSIAWLYGSGFPKSLDVSKAMDKDAGHWRGRAGRVASADSSMGGPNYERTTKGAPITPDAERWAGWGTALKPAMEPIVVARKPFTGSVAVNVLEHGTGGLHIDACRVPMSDRDRRRIDTMGGFGREGWTLPDGTLGDVLEGTADGSLAPVDAKAHDAGRWPTNVLLDDEAAEALGEPARYFPTFRYQAKAPRSERPRIDGVAHPTVKPLALMRWLVRLVTPPGGLVLDPFAGSGTTAEACVTEGLRCIAVEAEADYLPLILARLERAEAPTP
jgi:DNA modification methylase